MAEWAPAKWRKIHGDFVSSVKLRGVGCEARSILSTMIAGAWWDGESQEGRMYLGEGIPMSLPQLLAAAEVPPTAGRHAWKKLELLRVVGEIDGCLALLRFKPHQRGESATRMQRHRGRHSDAGVTGNVTNTVTEAEAELEAEADTPTPPAVASPRTGRTKAPPAQLDMRIEAVLDRIDEHRIRLGLAAMSREQRIPATIAVRLKAGVSVETLLAVADAFGRYADRNPHKRTLLCATTPFTGPSGEKPGGFAWGLSMLDEEAGPAAPTRLQVAALHYPSVAEIEAREAEEDARHAAR